ncbi:MAG: DUF427 domain-containing protein [Solirubrobacterales bacterium]|nr:DUF427 domain-containing protein [Solirubrobacterales bacterium]MBV9717552.1 DUF427 domain-containing protein [Solirubrobacterales bacterium]
MAALHPSPPFDELTYYPTSRWIRGASGARTVIDTPRAMLVWEPGKKVPIYAFPADDVALDPDEAASMTVRGFEDPDLDGYVHVPWDAIEHWYEEEEEVFVHPRDPFVRVDALRSSRRVRVERDGRLLAESDSPILVFETGLPTRYYLPQNDVDASVLADSDLRTGCPYKGFASYHDVVLDGHRHASLFWYYQAPLHEVSAIKGYLAPYGERVDLTVDGQLKQRPAGPLRRRREPSPRAA